MTRAGQETTVLDQRDFSGLHQPRTAPPYINTRNFVAAEIASNAAVIHPWNDPVLDSTAQVRLFKKGQTNPLAESPAMSFGFITPFPKPDLPERHPENRRERPWLHHRQRQALLPGLLDPALGESARKRIGHPSRWATRSSI